MNKHLGQASLVALLMTVGVEAVQGQTIELVPSDTLVETGKPLMMDVVISGLGDFVAPSISAFDFDLSFDNNILAFNSFDFGDPVLGDLLDTSGFAFKDVDDTMPGIVSISEVSGDFDVELNVAQPETFILGVANFEAIAPGTTSLDLTVQGLLDENVSPFSLESDPESVSVSTQMVTEPQVTLGILGLGVTLVLGKYVKRKT